MKAADRAMRHFFLEKSKGLKYQTKDVKSCKHKLDCMHVIIDRLIILCCLSDDLIVCLPVC